jgi:hypothetical protein
VRWHWSTEGTQGSNAQGSAGTPPTHDEASTEEALIFGTLDCLWLEVGDERHALILPSGSTTQQSGDEVILLDGGGNEIARTGDEVTITGGARDDEASCDDANDPGRVIVAGAVQRSADWAESSPRPHISS